MVSSEIIKIVNRFLDAVKKHGIKVDGAYIFGSYAKGLANQWSDIDVAIIVPKFQNDKFDTTITLRKIALDVDSRIEPIVFETESFSKDNWIPIIYEIRATGMPIDVAA